MPDNRYYYFKDAKGNRHTVNKAAFDNDREGFAKAFPGARMEVIDRKTGRRGDVDVKDAGRVGDFGAHLFTGQTVRREKYQPKTSLGKAAQSVAQEKWGGEESGNEPRYASMSLTKPLMKEGKESELVKGLREADALKRRDEEQMPIDYTKPSAVKQMVGRTHREQQTLDRRIEKAGREAGKDVMKPLREKEARLKTPVVDTGDADINSHVINTQEQAERQLAESGLEFANKHLDDYVSSNIINEFKTATAKGAAAESALSKASPFSFMAAGDAYNAELDPDKLLKHLQEKANADITSLLSNPKMQEEIGLKAAAYGISPEEYIEKSLIPGLQAKLASDFDKSELSRNMPKSTAEYILRGVNESMLGTIMSMAMTSKKQRQYAQQGMAMTDAGENPDVNPGMAARVARGTLGFVADAPVFGAAGKAGAAVAGKVFGNGVAQTARIANSTIGGRIARMAGSGMVSQGITGVLYGSTNAAVQNYSTGDDTSIGNTVKVMAMGGLSEGASWATMGGIGGAVGAGIYNVSGVKRIPAKAFQLAMEGIGMHMGGNVAKTIEGHDTDWLSVEGNLEACANVVALKLTHARLPKRQVKDGVKESYLDMVARNINGLMTSDGQRAAFGGYTFTNEEKEQLFGSASAPKRNESIYGYDAHNNPLTRKESLTSWAMRAKKTAAKGKGEESYKDTDAEFVKTAYDEIMADNTIPWDTKAKFSALVMGTVPSARPMMEYIRIEDGSVNEYSKNGELLSKNSFKTSDERDSILYSLNQKSEDQRLNNAYGAAQIKDEKAAQETLETVAKTFGLTAEEMKAVMDKDPLRRSEGEQNACVALRKAYEGEQFPEGTLHAEQSNTEGKDVVEENGLGTETPNNEAVAEVLGDLTKAEDALQAAMDGNDVLKEEYERMQKAGMSNPQIYMELFNSGLTQEQLAPLADYINALSKAQGMFKGTQDKIVETTQKHVGQWSYKGELNGEKQNGEQMVFVKDDKGRMLIVGAGDVAFDGEGRVRDGDMLTVYDPATREMDFVHAKDVTLERTTSSEEYAKDYQRQLEELNSTVYAEMQSGGEEGQPSLTEPAEPTKPKGEEGNEASLSLAEPTEPVGEKETTPVGEEPVATFADGTPVPMIKDSKNRETADYSQMTPEQGAEWIKTRFGENADGFVDGRIKRAEKAVKAAEKMKVDFSGEEEDVAEALASRKAAIESAEKELNYFTAVKNVMKQTKAAESAAGGEGATGNRYEQWRKDGYHIGEGGVRYDRQKKEDMTGVYGKDVKVDFTPTVGVNGRAKVVEVDSVQASHVNGQVNPMHFGPDWQPKDRTDIASKTGQDKALANFDPEKITGDGNAFIGSSPSVNERHEAIQGNNRVEILRRLYDEQPEKAAQYKQWLIDHAEEYGLDAAEIAKMKKPILVNELPVDDAKALELGQYRASDFESGGKELPRTSVVINRLGDKMQNVANIMLRQGTLPEDAKMSDLVSQNATKVLDYLVKEGVVSATEEQTLRKDSTAMRQWMGELLKTGLFEGDKETEAAFNQLPDNARRAVLATYLRDAKSGDAAKIKQNLQRSFEAYSRMMNNPAFVNAKNVEEARAAVSAEIEKGNNSLFGEEPVRELFSNFELELAVLYKGLKDQKTLTGPLNKYFDAVQGDKVSNRQLEIGEEPREAISKEEALKEVFGLHESKPAETQRQVDKAIKIVATEITKKTGIEVVTDEKKAEEALRNADSGEGSDVKFHKVTDQAELDMLNNEDTFPMYSGMQIIDGKLYSPMAAIIDGKRTDSVEMGDWHRADERPDLVKDDGTFVLVKTDKKKGAGEGDVPAAYNPYMHTSTSMMNDQFTGAYARGNIRVVEWSIPKSELDSGYHAEKAKDSVGMVPWHSGSVNGLLPKERQRNVMLSRWRKAIRVVPDSEVAEKVAKQLEGTDLAIPWNTFTPNQIREFAKLGVPITIKETGSVGKETKDAFMKQKAELEKEFPQAKFVDVKMTKDAYLKWGKNEEIKASIKEQKKAERKVKKAVKEFRTKDGEVYGFTDGEKIYLDTKKMKPETPLHEYAHLWCDMLRRVNPKEWENVKKLFDKVEGLKDEVQKLYPELEGDALYEEMITTYSGREGTKKLEDVVRKLAAEDGNSVTESAKAKGFLEKVKEALTKYWKGVADVLGIHFTTAEEVADKVLADWAKGVDPRESEKGRGKSEESDTKVEGNEPSEASLVLSEPKDEEPLPILPKKEENTLNPIVKAAENYKKDHPLTEEEIRSSDVDGIAKDMAVDYLNGEVTDDLHRAVYESIYGKVKDAKMKNAAEKFAKEKEAAAEAMGEVKKPQQKADDAAVEASNKKVNDLWNDLLKAGREDLSASFIGLNARQLEVLPKLVSAMAENAYLRIKRGMHNLEDVVKEMRKEFAPAAQVFKKEDVDAIYEQMMNIRYRDGEQRMSLKEWADYYEKTSPKHKEELVGDSKTAEERKQAEKKFIDAVKLQLAFGRKIKSIIELRKIAERHGLKDIKDTDLQELAEAAIVMKARGIASSESTNDAVKFERIKKLYENQPSLNQRDSERVMKQQYSTPAPYAFLADMYVKAGMEVKSALEPSAGNGMLTIGLPKDAVHVNDIDAQRLANLQRQGFKNITSQDGTQPFADKDVDVVVTNPPFGSATPKEYDGYKISSLEGQMAINALESMKDNGRAAIIIGGKTEYAKNGSLTPKDKALLGYLYSHYNVEDVINVDGSLYAKQGTTYPTRIILINGRRYDENAYPPVKDKARAEAVKSYDELYKRINDDILRSGRMDSPVGKGGEDANAKPNRPSVANTNEEGVRAGGSRESERKPSVRTGGVHDKTAEPVSDNVLGTEGGTKPGENGGLPDGTTGANGAGADVTQSEGAGNSPNPEGRVLGSGGNVQKSGGNGRPNTQPNADGSAVGYRVGQQRLVNETPKRDLDTEKVSYVAQSSNPFSLHSVVPADQAVYTKKALERIGDVDQFLVDELGYNDKDDMYKALASEQADSVALAIHQAKQGKAFIIGDMTGIGKGRQAAAMIRFAYKQGNIPVFITAKKDLFSDIYRDLKSIGNSELRPFIWAADDKVHSADMTDKDGNIVFKRTSDKEQKRVMEYLMKNGKLPEEYDYIVTTYDSFNSGTIEYENGNKKARKDGKGSKNGQLKRNVLEHIALNANVIMDESHKAGGQGGGSAYLQYVVPKLNAVTFLSATYAKRPDNMPIYALRTSMNQAGMESSELIDAIKRGGATLQEIMSQALASSGQFIRRERDMTGVTIDWKAIDDPEVVAEQREQYDSIIGLFNDIINFQRTYVSAYVDRRNEELAEVQSSMGIKRGTEALGIKNQPFASKTYNMVQQVLLSLKAREAAKSGIEHLKNGEKIVIALNNTNESQTGQFGIGEEIDAPDLGVSLKKGLEGTLRYTSKNAKDESESGYINLSDLGADAVEAYHALEEKIGKTSTGLSLSPIDVIRDTLENAGYSVGEMTGRQYMFVKNPNGTVSKIKRTNTDKKKLALDFNTNNIDALILNRSASTGISLHDSVEYDVEHKPRTMIVVQQQADVNEEVQMRGRIDRTGQVNRGKYEYIVSQIPSEQRLLMMFKAKLKSLDANTTSSQKSKFNDMEVSDIINKYGDKVVKEYMAEHLDLYARMADPFGWEKAYGADLSTVDPQKLVASSDGMSSEAGGDASKLLGRMALLKVKEQEKMLQEIGDLYAAEIQRLNEMGENDLEITELPLKAKIINKGIWKEGSEPGGDNAFADNTYVEKVNMAVLKKPMKAEEVKKAQDGLTGNRSWDEYRKEKITAAKEYFDNKITEATEKYEERAVKTATKAKEKYIKDAKKAQKDTGMSDEQIEKMAGYQYDSVYGDEKTKLDEVVKNLKAKYGVFERALETFNTDDAFVLPTDMNNPAELSGFGNSYGRLIDIKITDNFSPNASTVSFATLDGRRKITFPINGKVGIGSDKADVIGIIDRLTRQASAMGDKHLRVLSMDASNWDKLTSNESRKDGYIITGNLLQALIDTKEQGLGGQLVKYTTDTGEVKTGILMPEKFEPKGLANDKPINSVAEKFELPSNKGGITEITSSDGDVKIEQGFDYMKMARNYTIRVPKSNKKGGKYFLDKELLKMVDGGNFETRGNTMLAEIKADKLKDVLDRLSELGVKVREESGVHYRTDASLGLSKPLEGRIAETVEKVSKQTGGKVKMVNSVEEIGNEEVRRDIENGKQVTGWYDENTGEVHLYMPNIHDAYTAEKTVWHETVGHKGMRGLLGDKFNDYMRGLWMDLDNPVNAELRAYVKERMGKDAMGFYDAIEEFIAESAEKGKGEPGFWNNIKNKVTNALHEIGYRISPNVKDVKYMLWLAKNVQKKGNDPWWKMRADAVKWKIEHENVEYTKIHGGEFYENDGKSHDFEDMSREEWDEATDGQIHYRTAPSAATALDRYHSMLNAHGYMATEAFMDNMLSLDKLMKAVDPSIKKIEDVKSSMNPYVLQNTMQGAMSDKMTLFEHQVMKPLDKAMSDVLDSFAGKNTEEKIRECNLYMIGKHGLERNRVLFVRDWFRKMEKTEDVDDAGLDNLDKIWKGERSDLRRKLDSGQIDLREYYRQMDEWIVQNIDKDFKAEEHDYSGMHGLQEIDDLKSPYDDAGAIDSVMSQEAKMESLKKGSVDNLWKRIKDATDYSIDSDYENGLMDKTRHDRVKNMFDWYVPLRKYDEATAEDVYGYISGDNGKGFIGETLMNAKGRKSLSDVNVLAQIGAMGNRAIRNGGQNAVKQAFARFVRNSGEQNLVKETKVWVEKKGTDMNGNDIWEEAYPQIPDNASAHDIATIVDAFETDMKTKQAKGEAKTLSNSTDIGFKFARAKNKSEHFVDVKIAGRTHRFVVMGNPRAAQALNGMLENSSPNSALLKGLKSTTRFMAQMATSYSPEFVMRNIIRDAEFASSNVTAKEGVMYGKKWLRYYAELNPLNVAYNEGAGALKSLKWKDLKEGVGMGLYARYREGTLGNSKMERYFKEFMQNGGETGWVQVKTMQEWENDYKRDVSREHSKVAKTGKALRDFLVGNVENLNEVAENMARFATFCTSRDLGRSAVRSAYDAKQVSTNFNRHGSGDAIKTFKNGEMGTSKEMRRNVYGTIASYLKNYSMFFNAGVQSTHLLVNNVKKAPVGTVASMMAMPFGLGILAAVLNNAMIANEDEKKRNGVKDPYGELPEYIRRNNLCIYKGGGEFVTIPLAIELRAFYGLGDIAAGMTVAKNVKSTRNAAMDAVGCMSQLLPVVDFMNTSAFDKEPGKETLKGVLPTAAAPFVEWWLNSDWKGAPIRREGDYTKNRPAWMNAYSGTPEKLMDLNKWVNAKTNDVAPGNENMRGNSLLDEATDPAMLNHIIGTLGGGAATFITRGTGLVLKYSDGREQEIETKDIPFLRSLLYTPSEQTSMARTKAKWYGYKESMEKSTSNYSLLKNKNVPLTERIRNAADRHRFEQSADYARIRIIKDAEKQMKRWNKMKRLNADDKKQVDFANKNIEMIMQKAVEQMDKVSDD
nr:MAG TPA: P-loop containing NTP hydrolase pore-1 [Caudoviricetes sp.]